MSEIRLFAGDFAPKTWALCQGQTLPINTNQALFSLLGTIYGGDGVTTFKLPDLRGRTVIGTGQGTGLSYYTIGQMGGTTTVALTSAQIPQHTHIATITAGQGTGGGSATLFGVNDVGGQSQPGGNFLSQDNSGSGAATYAAPSSGTPVAMAPNSISASDINVPAPLISVGMAGGSQPHNNMMPSIVANYIICLRGIYPSRN
jgi:microcystin-dependent protein